MPTYADPALTGFPPVEAASPTLTHHAGQAALLLVPDDRGSWCSPLVVGVDGDRAARELARSGPHPADLFELSDGDWPKTPGWYVWRGAILDDPAAPSVPAEWMGDWRRAQPADLERFGVPTPRPRPIRDPKPATATPDRA